MDLKEQLPLVSCVMPTYNRREFVPNAIRYFLRQDYINKELIIIDDGTDAIQDLIPNLEGIRYYRLNQKISLGAKLNLACQYAKGSIIANWDDDDWYAERRLKYQIANLLHKGTEVCGINHLYYYDLCNNCAFQYVYPPDERTWLLGSSLCYRKDIWSINQFTDINVGMDALFVWGIPSEQVTVLDDSSIAVHMIHRDNVSPKKTNGGWWHTYPIEEIQKIIKSDWFFYNSNGYAPIPKVTLQTNAPIVKEVNQPRPLKNIYVCLIHESEDCVIDLVRNLYHQDTASTIILYNGGENLELIDKYFPFDKFNVILYPTPRPVKHGYLHTFALDCMQFALENLSFDVLTFVDSDQLCIRSGYSEYLGCLLTSTPNIGMLSSNPKRVTPANTNDIEVWPAIQAFKEYELWKPFLQSFPEGENNFVHWTFWPSTVFTADAVRDLVHLYNNNEQLQRILEKTQLWATEEVILPTLVKLLGYEIVSNPCSFEYVKYRKSYTPEDINDALNTKDAYWIHPIERRYENPHRKYIREYFNHYAKEKQEGNCRGESMPNLLLSLPLINSIRNIEGWLDDQEADLLIATTMKACQDLSVFHNIVEIGSYHGKSTILFGNVIRCCSSKGKIHAIDLHDGKLGAVDQELHSFPPSFEAFKRNIHQAKVSEYVEIIKKQSCDVAWEAPISLLFIDGLHDYIHVSQDFWHFANWITPAGYVAFHDYADYFPGVQAFVKELLGMGAYQKVHQVNSLIVLQKR